MSDRYAVIKIATGKVENVIIADPSEYDPGKGFKLVASESASIGDRLAAPGRKPAATKKAPARSKGRR